MRDDYIDLTLAYILYHAVCCASAASSDRSLHLIISQLRTKYSSSNSPNHVRRTKSSIKKRIIVRGTVRGMFGEQTLRPIKNGFKAVGRPTSPGYGQWLQNGSYGPELRQSPGRTSGLNSQYLG